MYSDEQQREILYDYLRWRTRAIDIIATLVTRPYATAEGAEYGKHGLGRRISTLRHSIGTVFDTLPMGGELPDRDDLSNATVSLQSFCINIVGALDNLARVWIYESGRFEGQPIAPSHIGFAPKNVRVRQSLPADFLEYLRPFDDWFEYIENYRHALAHRIPLYIPSRQYREEDAAERERLDALKWQAVRNGRLDEAEELDRAMHELGTFHAWMMHSFNEPAQPIAVHPQMICDLSTVIEVTERLLELLDVR